MPVTCAEEFDVVVVGAGVGGAAFALALTHAFRLRVLLVERHAGPGKLNRGDSLLPAVTAHLERWQALDRFRKAGARDLPKMHVYHHRAGMLMETSLDDLGLGHPYLVLPHPDIERVLIEAACATGRVEVRYCCRAIQLFEESGRVGGVFVEAGDGTVRFVRARLLVGADGATSVVRTAVGILLAHKPYNHGYFGIEMERPRSYDDAMRIELHPAGGILVVPHPSGQRVGLGVLVRKHEEALFRSGSLKKKVDAIRRRSALFDGCQAFPHGSHLYRLSRAHAPRYAARGAALLGDAIHVTNPAAGQGMTMAIEDAEALARHVGPALSGSAAFRDIDRALRAYESERRPANTLLILLSHWIAGFYAMDGAVGDWLRRGVFSFGSSSFGRLIQQRVWSRVAARGCNPAANGSR